VWWTADRDGVVHLHPVVRQTTARWPATGYTMGFAGLILIMLPGILAEQHASEVNAPKIWLRLSIFSNPPGEFAKCC